MKKIFDFIKSNTVVAKWTFWYFFVLWMILRFVFKFDMFSAHYWHKFFHATLHGFPGLVFGMVIYTAIPIYIATTLTVYRKKEIIFTIPFIDKVFAFVKKIIPNKTIEQPTPEPTPSETEQKQDVPEYPSDMPPELRVPYIRAKNNMSLTGAVSVYNKPKNMTPELQPVAPTPETDATPMPIPSDFDIGDFDSESNATFPTFKDINFDEPMPEPEKLENNTTRFLASKNIEFETYKNFVATEKYVIYEHNDNEFWVMDENIWFAAGKQIDSPIPELIELAKQNELIPVLYMHAQNVMDIESTSDQFESMGVRVIKDLNELN